MKANRLLLKIYGEQNEGQWSLMCLDFSLAAQAETLEEAQVLLQSQIKEYLIEALEGQDRAFAPSLLSRRAPAKYWLKWWWGVAQRKLLKQHNAQQKAFRDPMRMIPA